jgi:hypothetical protein
MATAASRQQAADASVVNDANQMVSTIQAEDPGLLGRSVQSAR